jgi:hypothetical protein
MQRVRHPRTVSAAFRRVLFPLTLVLLGAGLSILEASAADWSDWRTAGAGRHDLGAIDWQLDSPASDPSAHFAEFDLGTDLGSVSGDLLARAASLLGGSPRAQASATDSSGRTVVDPDGDKNHNRPEHGSLGNIGAKLSDPTADIWALSFNIQAPAFFDGDLNTGDSLIGANVIF